MAKRHLRRKPRAMAASTVLEEKQNRDTFPLNKEETMKQLQIRDLNHCKLMHVVLSRLLRKCNSQYPLAVHM